MSPATLDQALEPFFTTKPPGKGTGLGLSIVQGFARQSGGEVQIESAVGQGITISMFLPRAAEHRPALAADLLSHIDQRPRVLVVDDQEVVRRTLSLFLTKAGFYALTADCGALALNCLKAGERCDLVVTDQSMPGMTGCALIEEVSRIRPELPTVLITADEQIDGLEQLRGRVSVLRKPTDRTTFLRQVEALLGPTERSLGRDSTYPEPLAADSDKRTHPFRPKPATCYERSQSGIQREASRDLPVGSEGGFIRLRRR